MRLWLFMGVTAAALVFVLTGVAPKSAFIPEADFVVANSPSATRGTQKLEAPEAAARAQALIERSRKEAHNPRLLGQAQATLAPWWKTLHAPPDIILLRATIKQSLHDFRGALKDLALVDSNPQALLTQATVHMVVGEYEEARKSCEALRPLASPAVYALCQAQVAALNGELTAAIATAQSVLTGAQNSEMSSWAHAVLGEFFAWKGDAVSAQKYLNLVLAADANDDYARLVLVDALTAAGRSEEALRIALAAPVMSDALLLRIVEAQQKQGLVNSSQALELKQKFDDMRASGDEVHLRELARYELRIEGNVPSALAHAKKNFQIQKEPADALVLLDAAKAADNAEGLQTVQTWLRASRFEGVQFNSVKR
jgi:hypothetical protein